MAKAPNKPKNAGKPIAVRKDEDGDITHVLFEKRKRMTPLKQAINMTEREETEGVRVNKTKAGKKYLQDMPDNSKKDNLDSLPEK